MVCVTRAFVKFLAASPLDRRSVLVSAAVFVSSRSEAALGARGAAELDAEYYLRGALGLDRNRDVFDRREPRQPLEPDVVRPLDPNFAAMVLSAAGVRSAASDSDQAAQACEAIYLALKDSDDRTARAARIGDVLYNRLAPAADASLLRGATSIVDAFARANWIVSGTVAFTDGDDTDDTPRPLQVTLRRPVTAPVAARLERQGVLYHPDFIGLCLAAFFKRRGFAGNFDEYLLDDTYRTDPRAFQASSTLILFPLLDS